MTPRLSWRSSVLQLPDVLPCAATRENINLVSQPAALDGYTL
jgi:hypothetical protein